MHVRKPVHENAFVHMRSHELKVLWLMDEREK